MAILRVLKGPNPGQIYSVDRDATIMGRHPNCDVVLEIGAVSREHARIVRVDNEFFLEDMKSRNGTFLNNEQLEGRRRLNENDQVRICDLVLVFHHGSPEVTMAAEEQAAEDDAAAVIEDAAFRSTITSKLDISTGRGGLQLAVNAETKLKALLEILQALGKAVSLEEVLPKLLDGLFSIFIQADRGFIVLKERGTGKLIPAAVKHRREGEAERIRISRTIVNSVIESKEAILSADAATDEQFSAAQSIVDFQIHSMMCAPLIGTENDVLGVLQIDTHDQRHQFGEEDLELMASVAIQAAVAVENAQLHEAALREVGLKRDLNLAHKVQQGFLPDAPPDVENYEFFDYYHPARFLGGDYFDYVPLPDGRLAVVLADVSGKGVSASLLMAKLSAEMRFSLLSEPTPEGAVARLNTVFCESRWEDRFVTLALMVLHPRSHEVCIVNAGHMAPLLRHANATVEPVAQELSGLPIGVAEGMDYEPYTINMAIGDSLTAYTDGIPDAQNVRDEFYGTDRLLAKMSEPSAGGVESLGRRVIDDVRRFAGAQAQTDDMCVTIFGRTG